MNSHAHPAGIRNVDFRSSAKKNGEKKGWPETGGLFMIWPRGAKAWESRWAAKHKPQTGLVAHRGFATPQSVRAAPKSTLSALADGLQAGSKASPSPLYVKKGANSRGLKRHSAQFLLGRFAIDVGAKFLGTLIRPSRGQRRWRAGRWRRRRPRSAILRRRAG